ncbi:PREDICTED: trihelix transcription factor GT-2-like [Ipomoea nil]|uniref:trihelix transcription factor GT-2-like n=1 Tax=Ipomoea nil TaxID=35883 RepID=UPI000901B8E9|nr:PREDICTED: trihelix transcription factor GT-2-like [Ipomoea nil]
MLGVSGLISAAADGAAPPEAPESGGAGSAAGGGGNSSDVGGAAAGALTGGYGEEDKAGRLEEAERNSGGNRWPRQETLALLKIRSDMDVVFRDSSLKGPLWEEVSRKMAELGYHRSSKKCKEKFENVYKYHKRTKDGRASKADGKTYRFFDQLEAFEHTPSHALALPPPPRPQPPLPPAAVSPMVAPTPLPGINNNNNNAAASNASTTNVAANPPPPVQVPAQVTVPSTQNPFGAGVHNPINAPAFPPSSQTRSLSLPPQPAANTGGFPSQRNIPGSPMSDSTSSSTSSDEDIQRRHRRKRKWKDFFERLMKDVIEKQEELQKRFLEALEKRERDRMVREEAWRVQEMARMNREHDLLVQERSMAAAKDAAVLQFLQKVSEQHNLQIPITNATTPAQIQIQLPESLSTPTPQPPPPPIPPQSQQQPPQGPEPISVAPPATMPFTISTPTPPVPTKIMDVSKAADESFTPASSSRWPKTEVQALIQLRTNLDMKYQENGPKGPLWEEISTGMRKLGYNRNAKRCKEKWENINKYFKKVKESNKKRPEDSKTCPYFHLLDAIYKEKSKNEASFNPPGSALKPENNPMVPIMVQPEQQWPLPPEHHHHHHPLNDHESDNIDEEDDGDDDDDEDDDEGGGGYEIVTNKPPSTATTTATSTV